MQMKLNMVLDAACAGTFSHDIQNDKIEWDTQSYSIFGINNNVPVSFSRWDKCILDEDLFSVQKQFDDLYENSEATSFLFQYRIVRENDLAIRNIETRGEITRNELGHPVQVAGLNFDITERVSTEELLKKARGQLNRSQKIANLGNWDLDLKTGKLRWSDEIYRIFGREKDQLPLDYDSFIQCIHPEDAGKIDFSEKFTKPAESYDEVYRIIRPDNSVRFIREIGEIQIDKKNIPYLLSGTMQDVTNLVLIEKALIFAKEEAEHASKVKSEFLSSMSHELRTPLNAIMGFAQLILTNSALKNRDKDGLKEIKNAGEHLLTLINDILDLSKIESGKINLKINNFSLGKIIEECYALTSPIAKLKNIKLNYSIPGKKIFVTADVLRLKQALLNLLSNAIKYNKNAGEVTLIISRESNQMVKIAISDTGYGIPLANQKNLFEAFNRLGADVLGIEGTGIGLIITKKLVEMMKGEIGFSSTEGKGSTFWISIPSAPLDDFKPEREHFSNSLIK